ncbi:MAG: DUF1289 domain-containing protein [Turneriella sp.]|nr:DUF1289 domain-containing protein [Turneriella sp.]
MEKQLPLVQELKQKLKGTWDSPCIEVCSYKLGHPCCRACGLTRTEKKSWSKLNEGQKQAIRGISAGRITALSAAKMAQ